MFEITINLNSDPTSGLDFKTLIPLIAVAIGTLGAFVGAGIAAALAIKAYRTNQWWDTRNKVYQKAVETIDEGVQASRAYLAAYKQEANCSSWSKHEADKWVQHRGSLPKSEAEIDSDFYEDYETKRALKLKFRVYLAEVRFSEAWGKIKTLASQGRFNMSRNARRELMTAIVKVERVISDHDLKSDSKIKFVTDRLEDGLHGFSNAAKRDLNVIPWSTYIKVCSFRGRRYLNAILLGLRRAALIVWFGEKRAKEIFYTWRINRVGRRMGSATKSDGD